MQIEIRQTSENRRVLNDFITLPDRIYRDCPQYVPDLRSDIRSLFSKKTNAALTFSDICGLVAYRDGEPAGRVLALINHRANERWQKKSLRLNLLEYTDDIEVLRALLDAATCWGKQLGMTLMEGPLGFTDFDKEGMLVSDFEMMGSAVMTYNLPYYATLMEQAGMKKDADWISIRINIPDEMPKRFVHAAELVQKVYGFKVYNFTKHELTHTDLIYRVFELLDKAYSPLFGYTPFTKEQVSELLKKVLPLLDPELIPLIHDKNGKLIGIGVTIESLSEIMRRTKGKLFPTGWMHLLRAMRPGHSDVIEMLLIAVDPDYQGLGVNAIIFNHLFHVFRNRGYKYAETGPQLENNTKELSQWKAFSPQFVKRRRCYYKEI